MKGDKVVAFCDRNCNVIAPFVSAPGNRNESPMMRQALPLIMQIAKTAGFSLKGSIVSLDGAYDCRRNRKAIFNRGMTPNINERVFGWEDKFRRLLLRFDRLSNLHYAFKTLAYTLINLRHFCIG